MTALSRESALPATGAGVERAESARSTPSVRRPREDRVKISHLLFVLPALLFFAAASAGHPLVGRLIAAVEAAGFEYRAAFELADLGLA